MAVAHGDHTRSAIQAWLREHRTEIEETVLVRVLAISDPAKVSAPTYRDGLTSAVSAALEYGFGALERDDEQTPAVPDALLTQARAAARSGVGLDTVLRRYFAGYRQLCDVVTGYVEENPAFKSPGLQRILRALAFRFEHALAMVGDEYRREAAHRVESSEQRRVKEVERLLAGELLDHARLADELGYSFEQHHLGLVAVGGGVDDAIRDIAGELDRRHLVVRQPDGVVWAWLGGRRRATPKELASLLSASWPAQATIAVGEPGESISGWRLSNRQAAAALPVALRRSCSAVRYADVAILASVLQDHLLATSIRLLFLEPLNGPRDRGEMLRRTLHAYLAAGRNVSSAASALATRRQTVTQRLREIETRLGRPLDACLGELQIALQMAELDATQDTFLTDRP